MADPAGCRQGMGGDSEVPEGAGVPVGGALRRLPEGRRTDRLDGPLQGHRRPRESPDRQGQRHGQRRVAEGEAWPERHRAVHRAGEHSGRERDPAVDLRPRPAGGHDGSPGRAPGEGDHGQLQPPREHGPGPERRVPVLQRQYPGLCAHPAGAGVECEGAQAGRGDHHLCRRAGYVEPGDGRR